MGCSTPHPTRWAAFAAPPPPPWPTWLWVTAHMTFECGLESGWNCSIVFLLHRMAGGEILVIVVKYACEMLNVVQCSLAAAAGLAWCLLSRPAPTAASGSVFGWSFWVSICSKPLHAIPAWSRTHMRCVHVRVSIWEQWGCILHGLSVDCGMPASFVHSLPTPVSTLGGCSVCIAQHTVAALCT